MEDKKEGEKIKEWFNRFDEKLKPLRGKHLQMEIIKSEILDNQRILNEYKMDEQNKVRKKIKKGNVSLNKEIDKRLLRRCNIKNFQELEDDNIFLKRILLKIKERKENIKNGKKPLFKRYKTNNDYGNINYMLKKNNNINKEDKLLTPRKSNNKNNKNFLNKIFFNKNNESNKSLENDITKKERPFIVKKNTNLILDLETNQNHEYSVKDIINYNYNKNNTEGNLNCFFETLSQEENYGLSKSNSRKNNYAKNMIKMIKLVKNGLHNCELSGNILNNNIKKTKNILKFCNSPSKITNKKNLITKINYSKIKDIRDVERNIFPPPKENIKINKSGFILKSGQKNNITEKNNNLSKKKLLILPICLPNNKSYIKTNNKILI